MPRIILLLLTLAVVDPAAAPGSARPAWEVTDGLHVEELADGVWVHTSWRTLENGTRFPSNGLLVRDGLELYLVDAAWGREPTAVLLDWIDGTLGLPIGAAVFTHFHDDRMGGAADLAAREITAYAHPQTKQLASTETGHPLPTALVDLAQGPISMGPLEIYYPGPGHTEDNLVVWIPSSKVLFGGCAIRPATLNGLGNTADARVDLWPRAVERVKDRYGAAQIVVPSHGPPGGPELLSHTLEQFE